MGVLIVTVFNKIGTGNDEIGFDFFFGLEDEMGQVELLLGCLGVFEFVVFYAEEFRAEI